MKTKPILFSTDMVQANLAGRKTNTRRIVDDIHTGFLEWAFKEKKNLADWIFRNAKHKMGDVLWVRESFCTFVSETGGIRTHYKASANWAFLQAAKLYWKPSIHMPKEAARLFLKILNVRVERLQDISAADAIAEGILPLTMSNAQLIEMGQLYSDYSKAPEMFNNGLDPISSFKTLWQKINGIDSWKENPFVWVYEYQIIEKPKNFLQ
ncbi:hypothetical protein ACFQO9_04615 [Chryseobacterium zhengzhouense]|uniref:Uncharacterized protein n=1 Tax=Chryseobacterium zhengzhouense TaxID=1636086 RepID=A0ABW2LWH9_9FLAO